MKLANIIWIYARLSKKFLLYYAVKYAQYINDLIPIKDLTDKNGLPSTPYQLVNNIKPNVKHLRVFGCPGIFKRYETSEEGKRMKNKYIQQGIRNNELKNFL